MGTPSRELPTGTVTFLFTDIEGSTELARRLGLQDYKEVLELHNRLLRQAFEVHGGVERGTQGDAFLVVFRDAPSAVAAAVDAQRSLAGADWPHGLEISVRMGAHTGEGILGGDDYVGDAINLAARIGAAAHGGQILISDATRALAERSLVEGISLRDRGLHRFKGLDQAERLHQVAIHGLRTEFPPVRSLSRGLASAPARSTTFLGRDRELVEIGQLLARNRLVTLIGPGGVGKTSLAIEVVKRAADRFADGAVFVPLESVAQPDVVGSAVVVALGLRDTTGRPAREQLLDNLSGREILLVLDNFEHVLGAAPLVGDLLQVADGLTIAATSRAPLRLPDEQLFPVNPLPTPNEEDRHDLASLGSVESVRLFVDRARRAIPDFVLDHDNAVAVSEICRLVDGLPLGIELAAARISLLGPAGIRDRLTRRMTLPGSWIRGGSSRQQTLERAIAWSHDLLDEPSRALLRRLSVFTGGCRLHELELVCLPPASAAEPAADLLDSLARLVEQSLVIASQGMDGVRYEMLGTIRDFAAARLADDPDRADVERRHALAYMDLAEINGRRLEGRDMASALALIAREVDNLRAAVRWAIDHDDVEVGLRIAAALARFWFLAGQIDEGRTTFEAVLGIPGADAPTAWRMRALEGAGLIHYYRADNDRAVAAYEEQLDIARQLGDRRGEADAMFNYMFTQDLRGRMAEGMAMIDQIAEIYRELGDDRWLARSAWVRSNLLASEGHLVEAQRLLEEIVVKFHALGDASYEMQAASTLALGGLLFGDRNAAARWFPATFAIAREVSAPVGGQTRVTVAVPLFAAAAMEFVGPSEAATLLGAYEAMCRRYGTRMPLTLDQMVSALATRERASTALGPADFESALEAGRAMSVEDTWAYLEETIGRIPPAAERN